MSRIKEILTHFCSRNDEHDTSHHPIVKSACSVTFYPELCFSEVVKVAKKVRSQKDVVELSLNITTTAVEHNYFHQKLLALKGLTVRQKTAIHDCLETVDETIDELHEAVEDLHEYPNKKSLAQHADDLKTLISAAMTNQETCLDGFSYEEADKKIRQALIDGEKYVEKMCSNALAMIKNLTDTDIANEMMRKTSNRKLKEDENGIAWPDDGRTRTIITGSRNVVDGSTTFHSATVSAVGAGFVARDITFENTAGSSKHQAVALRVGSDLSAFYQCDMLAYQDTLYAHSNRQFYVNCLVAGTVDFIFGNAAAVFQDCDIHARRPNSGFGSLGILPMTCCAYQDTLYAHSNRQFYVNCLVAGTVDFILATLQPCSRLRHPCSEAELGAENMVTAQGRTDPNQNTGITLEGTFKDCHNAIDYKTLVPVLRLPERIEGYRVITSATGLRILLLARSLVVEAG
ncbi:Pectinesterase 2 [Hibiscus syriacus]|uniref:Pectinesterase n=1 Tax=Hibiscus syriacus TaxID=106335 RepID=A0A6A3A8L0_HIBSY|nr:Pectinesterase 2 [Hibiscus syriacus]